MIPNLNICVSVRTTTLDYLEFSMISKFSIRLENWSFPPVIINPLSADLAITGAFASI